MSTCRHLYDYQKELIYFDLQLIRFLLNKSHVLWKVSPGERKFLVQHKSKSWNVKGRNKPQT